MILYCPVCRTVANLPGRYGRFDTPDCSHCLMASLEPANVAVGLNRRIRKANRFGRRCQAHWHLASTMRRFQQRNFGQATWPWPAR